MNPKPINKVIAKETHAILKARNPNAKLSDAYELLARSCGFRDWNTAAGAKVEFDASIIEKIRSEIK